MKSLKFLKEELLSKANDSKVLSTKEQKEVIGGAWGSASACASYCYLNFRSRCYVDYVIGNAEYWECRES